MANIRLIAKHANVSTATVSRVLNNQENVSDATRKLVWQTAQELNYPLEKLRVAPPVSRSVLVLLRDDGVNDSDLTISREFERNVWMGVQSVFEQRGIATRLQSTKMLPEEAAQYAADTGISGLVLLGGVSDHSFFRQLIDAGLPFVVVGSHLQPIRVNCVMADVMPAIRQVVAHLADRGRRRIGLVNGPDTTMTSAAKLDGFQLELNQQGLPYSSAQVVAAEFSANGGYVQTQELLKASEDLDAIIYADDVIAVGGMRALREAGLSIPQDVAVVGFGDYEVSQFTAPALTSVHYDMHAMGVIAARRLHMILDEPDDQHWVVMRPTELVVRDSS